jgi:hypothetical protein
MKTRILAVLLGAVASMTAANAFAADPPNFDFNGYAIIPGSVGGTLILRSVLTNNGVVPTPILLDFATKQHTLVVTGTLGIGSPQPYSGVTLELWSDGGSGSTVANYAIPGTFVDGDRILTGVMPAGLLRYAFSPTLGSYIGKVNWTGGSRFAELTVTTGWPFGGGWSRRSGLGIPPGYQENWDGKIDFNTVGVEEKNWDRIKELYR